MEIEPRRIFGLETEYGFNAKVGGIWYPLESGAVDPLGRLFTDLVDRRMPMGVISANAGFLNNGARMYWDKHPEVSTAESESIIEVVADDVANDHLLVELLRGAMPQPFDNFRLTRRVLNRKNRWGRHENYLIPERIYREPMIPTNLNTLAGFLAIRPLITGAGYVTEDGKFRLAQKASHVVADFHSDTIATKPLVNTRMEALADPTRWRRAHIPCADTTNPHITAMGLGVTSLCLRLIEMGRAPRMSTIRADSWHHIARAVSSDVTLTDRYGVMLNGLNTKITALGLHEFMAGKMNWLLDEGLASNEERRAFHEHVDVLTRLQQVVKEVAEYTDPVEQEDARLVALHKHIGDRLDWSKKFVRLVATAKKQGIQGNIFDSITILAEDLKMDTVAVGDENYPAYYALQSRRAQTWAPADLVEMRQTQPPEGRARVRGDFIDLTKQHMLSEDVTRYVNWDEIMLSGVAGEPNGVIRQALGNPFGEQAYSDFIEKVRNARAGTSCGEPQWRAI